MIEWQDEGMLLAARPHGESAAIIELFTPSRGRHAGVVPGGAGRRMRPVLQPGAQLAARWQARLESHLGRYSVEPLRQRAPALMAAPGALACLEAMRALLLFTLPERQPFPALYEHSVALADALTAGADWPGLYLLWERHLLEALGYGLDLSACAVTGAREDLTHVSPRSGRAVSRRAAAAWADRLLPLPPALLGAPASGPAEVLAGLRTTGHFLAHRVAPALGERPLPLARARLLAHLERLAARAPAAP